MERDEMIRQLRADREAAIAAAARQYDEAIASLEKLPTTPTVILSDQGAPTRSSAPTVRRPPSASTATYPRGPEAVRQVLIASGREMTVRQVSAELEARGWAPRTSDIVNATSTNAARAAERLPDVDRRKNPHGGYLYFYCGQARGEEEEGEVTPTSPSSADQGGRVYAMPTTMTDRAVRDSVSDEQDQGGDDQGGDGVREVMS